MKKVIALSVVVLVAASLFAGFNAGLSVGFEQFNGKIEADDDLIQGRKNSFAIAADVSYDINDDFSVFDSFTYMPGKVALYKTEDSDFSDISDGILVKYAFKNRFGVAYNLPFNTGVKFSAGASFVYGFGALFHDDADGGTKFLLNNMGIGLNLKASYPVSDSFSAFIAADGDFAFHQAGKQEDEKMSFSLFSFSFAAKAGVMYSF